MTEEKRLDNTITELKQQLKGKKRKTKKTEEQRLQNKLMRVITKAGLSWTSWISLIEISDFIPDTDVPIPTACWMYNEHTKKERICISTRLMKDLPIQLLILVLKHEMLHKSMYRGSKNVGNQELMNFALDAAINKILWLSNPKQAAKLGNWLFPHDSDSRSNVMAIMNPGLETEDRRGMDPRVRMIVDDIWWVEHLETDPMSKLTVDNGTTCNEHFNKHGRFGNYFVPDPMTLYNKMASLLSKRDKKKIKAYYKFINAKGENSPNNARGGLKGLRAVDKITIDAESQFAKDILDKIKQNGRKQDGGSYGRGGGYSAFTDMEAYFERYVYESSETETEGISDFIHRWETLKQLEGITMDIYSRFKKRTAIEPYPHDLTRTGLELIALGVSSPEMPYFFNNINEGDSGKKKVCFYCDTSPSMNEFIPFMVYVVDFIDSCEECEVTGGKFNGKYAFSEKVKGIPEEAWEDFKNGDIRGGGGTSFDAITTHAIKRIENDEVDVIIVFTDGFSYISDENIELFNQSGKKCYPIYFAHGNYGYGHSRRSYGNEMGKGVDEEGMTSDLDKLDGESFTIWCKKE